MQVSPRLFDPNTAEINQKLGLTASVESNHAGAEDATNNTKKKGCCAGCKNVNINNLLNILGYVLSLVTSYLGGVAGWFGGVSNAELSSKYQTLITPSAAYFGYIWAIIFLFEGFFAVAQLLPRFKDQPLVEKGIGWVYFMACCAQSAWAITFGYEMMISAFVAMFALLVTLLLILTRQWNVIAKEDKKKNTTSKLGESSDAMEEVTEDLTARPPRLPYWVLRFPFAVHAGWIGEYLLINLFHA